MTRATGAVYSSAQISGKEAFPGLRRLKKSMKVLVTGGGTGGHIYPAIAIANTIRKHNPDAEIAFVGTPRGMENRLVPQEGYPIYHVEIQGLRRKFSFSNIKTLILTVTSVKKAKKLIREFQPDLVIGTGGYVCWPVCKAAAELHIPTALHESNAVPGVAVKMLAGAVDRIYTNFEETAQYLKEKDKILRVGNPLRGEYTAVSYENARIQLGITGKYRWFLLSCGGSLGAARINSEILSLMQSFTSQHPEILHVHAAGSGNYKAVKEQFEQAGLSKYPNLVLMEYIFDMPLRLSAADLVINRAGAMTLSELAALGKPSILIPSPNVTNNHQYKNAKVLSDAGAAILIEESQLNDDLLARTVEELLTDREERRMLSDNFRKFSITDSNNLIYNDLMCLVKSKKT